LSKLGQLHSNLHEVRNVSINWKIRVGLNSNKSNHIWPNGNSSIQIWMKWHIFLRFWVTSTAVFNFGSFKQLHFNLGKIQALYLNLHTITNIWGDSNSLNLIWEIETTSFKLGYNWNQWWSLETCLETCLETRFLDSRSQSWRSQVLVSVSKDFGLSFELFVSRLCIGYFLWSFARRSSSTLWEPGYDIFVLR